MSPHVMKKLAKPMLFAAAIIWGTSFFVMKNALDVIPVFYLLAIRFTAGAVLLAAVMLTVVYQYRNCLLYTSPSPRD